MVAGDEVAICCPFACGQARTTALSRFVVGTWRGPQDYAETHTCPHCGVRTVSDEPAVICPMCAGY